MKVLLAGLLSGQFSKRFLPLVIFIVLLVFLAIGLGLKPREIPSPLIDNQASAFNLPVLGQRAKMLSQKDLLGKVWMLNVWASWYFVCRTEHPLLVDFAKTGALPIYGLNYKDKRDDAIRWLTDVPPCSRTA